MTMRIRKKRAKKQYVASTGALKSSMRYIYVAEAGQLRRRAVLMLHIPWLTAVELNEMAISFTNEGSSCVA